MSNTNTITVNLDNLKPDERERLLELVEKANNPKRKLWKPEGNEEYFYLASVGVIYSANKYMDELIRIGNYFKTEEDAEFALERLKVIQRMKEIAAEEKFRSFKYYIWYKEKEKAGHVGVEYCGSAYYTNEIYFPTKELANKAITEIGEENIKKYYFQVPDNK